MQIVLDTRGVQLSVRNFCFHIYDKTSSRIVHPQRVSSFLVTAPSRISSPAMLLAAENQIPIVICTAYGRPEVRIWSSRFLNTSALRRRQYDFTSANESLHWTKSILTKKMKGQADNLKLLAKEFPQFKELLTVANAKINTKISEMLSAAESTKKQLLYFEAHCASVYWQNAGCCLPEQFRFTNRFKKHPDDTFNICINYLYGMLRNTTETAILSVGLDPALGILHRDGYKMPSLVFDFMEPFRPLLDRILLREMVLNSLPPDITEDTEQGKRLSRNGRRYLISLYTKKLESLIYIENLRTSLKNHLYLQVDAFVKEIKNHNIPSPNEN